MSWASSAPPSYAQSQSPPAAPYVNYNMQIQAPPSTSPGGTPIDQVKHFVNTNRRLVLIVVVVVVIAAVIIIGVVLSRSSGSKELGPPGPNYIQNACTNFYHFACDPWLKSGTADQYRWYSPITRNNIANTQALFANVAALHPAVQSLSRSCNDLTGVAAAGVTPLLTYLAKVTSATTWAAYFDALGSFRTDFLTETYVHLEQLPIDRNTNLYVLQGGLTLDENLYSNQARMNQYQSEIARAFRVFGDSSTIAATNAASVVQHEIALLNIMQRVPTTLVVSSWSSLQSYTGTWMRQYLQGAGYPLTDGSNFRVTVYTPQYFSSLQSMFTGLAPSNQHIQYGRWRLINTTSAFLSYPTPTNLYDSAPGGSLPAYERFRVAKPIYMRPPEPRVLHTPNTLGSTWSDYCESVIQLDELTNDAFGSSFINRTMSTQAQTYVSGMVQQILNTFSSYVRTLDWADSASRDAFVNKIANMNSYVAGPTPAPGYAGIQSQLGNTGASFFENTRIIRRMQELNRFSFQNLPWDNKLFWQGPASTVNAYYFSQGNAMFLFAGIMQQPAFQYSTNPYVTLRNMAWLYFIGHEAGHGFDTNGIQFNARGLQTSSWISSSTRSKFSSLQPCVVSSYSGLSEFGVTVDGRNTLNENIADIIGVRVITKIYKDWQASNNVSLPANFQPQVSTMDQYFWTLIAQNQCEMTNAATLRWQRVNDVHSPGHARANGPAANMEEFGLTFGCRQGEDMYPYDQCFIY